ncbi:PREFOLDIN SUBUNIT 6 [Salix purpurea]|uniref:PREFOLDIN SUBUNIT 6 n=1 Tax=Salix purpurea TaxID=77065 RepID=A0A9Q0WFM5_SALPP|nr:PREFOLDIN SUBUNIT 6 [Salix purpurea]
MGSSTAIRELQRDLENKANDLSKHQKDIAKNHQVRKKYTIQLGENELVLKELDLLNDDANVYKLIGPVLVKQDLAEANANVRKRIDYISAELKRLDGTLQDLEEKQNSKKDAVCGFPFSCLIQFIIEVPCHMPQYGTRGLFSL